MRPNFCRAAITSSKEEYLRSRLRIGRLEKCGKIELDPDLEPSQQLKRKFQEARKLKAGVAYAERFLDKAKAELEQMLKRLEMIDTLPEEEPEEKPKPKKKSHPFREYTTQKGLIIYVAKNARQNEELTFSFGRGLDYWLHVADFPGSHVLLRSSERKEPDQESLLDAAQLALHFSKAKDEKMVDVTVSQVKFLKRGKQTGSVMVGKSKTMLVRNDLERLKRLEETTIL